MKQKVTVFTIPVFVASFLLVLFSWLRFSDRVYAGACMVPAGSYPTIQSAVNDPLCSLINVAAGTYVENVTITNRTVTIQGAGADSTIVVGKANDSVFYINNSDVSLIDMTITNGQADSGGGIAQLQGTVAVINSVISNNHSSSFHGGGIYKWGGTILLENTIIRDNTSPSGNGGAVFHTGATSVERAVITITNSLIENNHAVAGGGIYHRFYSDMVIVNSIIRGNTAFGCGGGIQNSDQSSATIISSTVFNNSVIDGGGGGTGGGICGRFDGMGLHIINSAIISNTAGETGGGIYSTTALTITNSTVSHNNASIGAGIYMVYENVAINNSTIVSNTSEGLYSLSDDLTLHNTMIALNMSTDCTGSITSLGYNLDSDNSCNLTQTTDLPNTNPLIGPLENNGGPTETHALLFGSPAIDAGDSTNCPATDQRGVIRPQGLTCDIGAYEFEGIEAAFSASIYTAEEDAGLATITVTLDAVAPMTITVDYETGDGTATAGDDYTTVNGTLTFAPGSSYQTFDITVTADLSPELDETVLLTLTNPISGILGIPPTATLTLINDDSPTVTLSQPNYNVEEATGVAIVTATLDMTAPFSVAVDWATSDSTATAGDDYTDANGSLFFAPDTPSLTFTIPITDDGLPEVNETFIVSLSNPVNVNLGSPVTSTVTIVNDDESFISFEQAGYNLLENADSGVVTVTLDVASPFTVTIDYTTNDGAAIGGEDYTAVTGTITFAPGITAHVILIPILNDDLPETSEELTVTLTNPGNANLGTINTATVTLLDDGDLYTIFLPFAMKL